MFSSMLSLVFLPAAAGGESPNGSQISPRVAAAGREAGTEAVGSGYMQSVRLISNTVFISRIHLKHRVYLTYLPQTPYISPYLSETPYRSPYLSGTPYIPHLFTLKHRT